MNYSRLIAALLFTAHASQAFLQPQIVSSSRTNLLASSTPQQPLYDATNYTFPDTTTPAGIADVLEVSFIHACMQLSAGYVDVLKMFIAAAMSSYQFGFGLDEIAVALDECENDTANRPLMPEEIELRQTWYSVVYLTLLSMDHATVNKRAVSESIPKEIKDSYGDLVTEIVKKLKANEGETISLEEIMKDQTGLSPVQQAIMTQSLRVATLTPVVLREALEAGPGGQKPPTPPIEGAFE